MSARRRGCAAWPALAALLVALALFATPRAARAAPADDAMRRGDWRAAVTLLEAERLGAPRSAAVARRLGVARLGAGDATGAVTALREALERNPRDRSTLWFLGRAAERAGDPALALDAWRALLARGGGDLAPVRARVDSLVRASAREQAREAIRAERSLRADAIPANTIAVPDFTAPVASDSLRPLGRGLAAVMLTDLSHVPQLRVVERERLSTLLDELARGSARGGGVDPATAPRVGKLVGARRLAQGSVVPVGRGDVQLGASLIDVSTGTVRAASAPAAGPVTRVLELERTLVYQILDTLRIPVDDALRRRIGPLPTRSFPAFLAFSKGLDLEARGLTDDARREYANALRADPGFRMARDRSDALVVDAGGVARLDAVMLALAIAPVRDDFLLRGAAMAGFDGAADAERGTTAESRLSPVARIGFRDVPIVVRFP